MFYLWPQGRIVRICTILLGVLIAADLALNGAYPDFANAFNPEANGGGGSTRRFLIMGSIYGALALGALLAGLIAAGPHKRAVQFLIDVQDEMTKVDWPKPGQLWKSTLVVAVAITIIASIVVLNDMALIGGLNFIRSLFQKG